MSSTFLPCPIKAIDSPTDSSGDFDCYVFIEDEGLQSDVLNYVNEAKKFDKGFNSQVSAFKHGSKLAIYSPLDLHDYGDVREYFRAARNGILRAVKAGYSKPLLFLPSAPKYKNAELNVILGALAAVYVPIQYREDVPDKAAQLQVLNVSWSQKERLNELIEKTKWMESGLYIARDIGGGDPERMSPPNVAKYVEKAFTSGIISVNILSNQDDFVKEYPLFAAVNRAARSVPRHQGRIIWLEYKPPKPAKKTLMLVGKGVTYDTGGADVKAGGHMAGMSRDKCGAAAIAGFMKSVELKQPEDIHVIAALCMVRNSIGEECYVADEIITTRAGVRIRVGNTDAEGRMAMADALCVMKERAVKENLPNPYLYTIATLTGHAVLALGHYTGVMDNKVAEHSGHGINFCKAGEMIGDPSEISAIRKEDFEFIRKNTGFGEDLLQCNNEPSSQTLRGHQFPAAFLIVASGLDKHDSSSSTPLKYSHLDIAGSSGDVPDTPTGSPILSLSQLHLH